VVFPHIFSLLSNPKLLGSSLNPSHLLHLWNCISRTLTCLLYHVAVWECTIPWWRGASGTAWTLSSARLWASKRSHVSTVAPRSSWSTPWGLAWGSLRLTRAWPPLTNRVNFVAPAKILTVEILSASICGPKKVLALLEICTSVRFPLEQTAGYENG